jgi:UPF0755 protein
MSQFGLGITEDRADPDLRPPRRGRGKAALAVLLSLLVVGAVVFGVWAGISWVVDRIPRGTPDYAGPGSGEVVVAIQPGDSVSAIGATLVDADVVKSVKAFVEAAEDEPTATQRLQPGSYAMLQQMRAADALALLLEPGSRIVERVTIPEGLRLSQTVDRLVEGTDLPRADFEKALQDPASINLPKYAEGTVEGFLFPATYEVEPDTTAVGLLSDMTGTFARTADEIRLVERARDLGYTPLEMVTIASFIQSEASRDEDLPKVARAIYNRLDAGMPLQLDSTVNYATGKDDIFTSDEDRASDSPYNTYRVTGLTPGPISNPGQKALEAALQPADGPWLYWVTVNLDTGETKFAETFADHQRNVAELQAWVAANR